MPHHLCRYFYSFGFIYWHISRKIHQNLQVWHQFSHLFQHFDFAWLTQSHVLLFTGLLYTMNHPKTNPLGPPECPPDMIKRGTLFQSISRGLEKQNCHLCLEWNQINSPYLRSCSSSVDQPTRPSIYLQSPETKWNQFDLDQVPNKYLWNPLHCQKTHLIVIGSIL